MPSTFTMTRRVAFSETDAAGIVHFANFFRYMEDAEHAFLRGLGLSVHVDSETGTAGFPRVSATCDYQSPLHFEESFNITLTVRKKSAKSITYRFDFAREADGEAVATGQLTVVYVTRPDSQSRYRAAPLPEAYSQAIEAED